jgi:hypothetical protein
MRVDLTDCHVPLGLKFPTNMGLDRCAEPLWTTHREIDPDGTGVGGLLPRKEIGKKAEAHDDG